MYNLKLILILINIIFSSISLYGNSDKILNLANTLFSNKEYNTAITEYKRYYFFNPKSKYTPYIFSKIGDCYKYLKDYNNALKYYILAQETYDDEEFYYKLSLKISIIYILQQKFSKSEVKLLEIYNFSNNNKLKKESLFYLAIIEALQYNWEKSYNYLIKYFNNKDQTILNLKKWRKELELESLKNPLLAYYLSLVPGIGQIYSSNYKDFFAALGINSLNTYILFSFLQNKDLYGSIVFFISTFLRYYTGNMMNAKNNSIKYNNKINKKNLKKLFNILDMSIIKNKN